MTSARLGAVDGLRGIAIAGVIWHHLAGIGPGWSLLSNGWLGVSLFFVLSGLVLHLPYARGSRTMVANADLVDFYRRRATLLLPLYYVNVAVLVAGASHAILPGWVPPSATEIALLATIAYTFTKTWYAPTINSPLWSLGIEVWFSVVFPLLAVLARRMGIARLLVGVAVFALAARFAGVLFPIFDRPHNPFLNPMKDGLLGRLDDFVVGMLLAELVVARSALFEARHARWLGPLGLLLLCAGASLWDLKVAKTLPASASPLFYLVVDAGAFCVTAAAIGSRGIFGRVLSSAALQVPGKMCFSVYVWHVPLKRLLLEAPTPGPGRYCVYFVVLAVVSVVSYRFVERQKDLRPLFQGNS